MAEPVSGTVKSVAGVGAGVGLGAVLASLVQGNPALVSQIANWGPALLIMAGMFWLADRHAPQFISAQRDQASAMRGLSDAIQERFHAEDDVRLAVRALSGQIERMAAKLDVIAGDRRAQ